MTCNNSEMFNIYIDTSLIIKYSKFEIENESLTNIKEFYCLQEAELIKIYAAQGTLEDIFSDYVPAKRPYANDRYMTMLKKANPLTTKERDCVEDFDDYEIEIYGVLFSPATRSSILSLFNELSQNDKNDYTNLCDFIEDSNNYSYFLTFNTNHFIANGRGVKIESIVNKYTNRSFKIRSFLDKDAPLTLEEIKRDIKELSCFD